MEGLEPRQMLAANLASTGGVHPNAIIDPNDNITPANIGMVNAATFAESEPAGTVGQNDTIASAELVPLGTRTSDEPLVDISGTLSLLSLNDLSRASEDVDFYAVDLRAGDILDLAGNGAAGSIDVLYENGSLWFGLESNTTGFDPEEGITPPIYPAGSPLQTLGNVVGSQVVPETGRYFIRVGTNELAGSYTIGARTYRPVLESQPIGTQQTLFLDFDGFIGPRSQILPIDPETGFPSTGMIRIDPMRESLFDFDLLDRDEDELIDKILSRVERDFGGVAEIGGNGDFADTGTPGEYGIQVLNSRDRPDAVGLPHVTRVIIGGNSEDIFMDTEPAPRIDVGNFDTSETLFSPLDLVVDSTDGIEISGAVSQLDLIAQAIAVTVSREAGLSFGLWHTDGTNRVGSLVDGPGPAGQAFDFELGPDGIFGTEDDVPLTFPFEDRFDRTEEFFGFQRVAATLAHVLSTGTAGQESVGQTISGRVFRDLNEDGRGTGDPGLAGITVFADLNNDGIRGPSEPSAVTTGDGSYQLQVFGGSTIVTVVPPANSVATTPVSRDVSAPASGVDFGFADIPAGVVFVDLNGDGTKQADEPGLPGAHLYLDLDNDGQIDVGEPHAISGPDGSYTIEFPGPGTYTLRQVPQPGFVQTVPASGSYVVQFDGVSLNQTFPFGNQPATPDFDATVVPPLVEAGEEPVLKVVVQNEGPTVFLNAWVDFNRDMLFEAAEQIVSDRSVGSSVNPQTLEIPFTAPATPGDVNVRLRFSREPGALPTDPAATGEVKDFVFTVRPPADLVVQNDTFTVGQNTSNNVLNVLRNDFQTDAFRLTVTDRKTTDLETTDTRGTVEIAADGRTVLYTPPDSFRGLDRFAYVVTPTPTVDDGSLSQEDLTGTVEVNVEFQSANPIAVDDTFQFTQIPSTGPLNLPVLDNDVPSVNGGLTIDEVFGATEGGSVQIASGGETVLYTPALGFSGTEQFSYTVEDSAGNSSTAQVTVNLPGSEDDDEVAFIIETFGLDGNPLTNVQVGDEFKLQVSVDLAPQKSIFSAFLDLLYTDEFVSLMPQTEAQKDAGSDFPFDITFGELFANPSRSFQQGDADTPGLLNEVGASQNVTAVEPNPLLPTVLFTVGMTAIRPGVARFQADPADLPRSEVLLLDSDTPVPVSGLRLGSHNLLINEPQTGSVNIVGGASGSGEGESRLQNQSNPYDVNNDGVVSPIDALFVINSLNSRVKMGEGEAAGTVTVTRFPDVNGDGEITPADALMVINALNKQGAQRGAEGEGTPVPLIPVDPPHRIVSSEEAVDADFQSGSVNDSAPSASSDVQAAKGATGIVAPAVNADDDDDEEDVIALLADDVHNVWK